jgi:phosphoenolpyruvate synthase/pyruvate phosphate dikinase
MLDVLEKVDEAVEAIFALGKKWRRIDFRRLPDKELLRYHRELFYWDEILWRKGQIQNLLELHNNYLSAYVRELINATFGKNKEAEYFQVLSAGDYRSMSERQDEDFAELVKRMKKIKRASKEFEKLLKKHTEKYTWMIYGWTGPALQSQYFLENVLVALRDSKVQPVAQRRKADRKINRRKRESIIKKFSGSDQKLVYLLRKLLDAKAIRVDAHSLTYFMGDKIYAEISRRKFISINQLRVVPPEEVPKLFQKSDSHQLNAEYDFVIYWYERGKGLKKFVGADGKKKFQYIKKRLPKIKRVDEIKGEMAYMGKAKGQANLILEQADFPKFKKGEILVTRMTDPSFVPLMKISKAIVTDIGGITCHAAIVSRELKIPCVIGTKIGTKVLKTGDLLEVDANQGIVKKIN